MSKNSIQNSDLKEVLAGVVGFEPTIYCTKNRCPTARPHPIREAVSNVTFGGAQEGLGKKNSSFFRWVHCSHGPLRGEVDL